MELLVVLIIGFVSSFLGSFISGGWTIVAFSLFGLFGFSPLVALATFKLGSIGGYVGGFYNYKKADKVLWSRVRFFTVVGVIAAYIGTRIVISVDEAILSKIIGFALLMCGGVMLLKPDLAVAPVKTSPLKQFFGHVAYFLTTVYAYSVVVGAGIIGVYTQAYFYGMTLLEIKGTAQIPNLMKAIVAVVVLESVGIVDWTLGGAFFLGSLFGGFIGSYYSVKVGDFWLRRALLVTVFVVSIKLILGL